jgi:mono/diheme cytochrome c family protein
VERIRNFRPPWSPGLFRAALVGAFVAAFVVPLALVAIPFLEFFNDMAAQPKGKAQMTYGRTFDPAGDGWMVERLPAEGTLPRGVVPYAFAEAGNSLDDARAVGQKLANPLPYTMENLQRGRKVFTSFCAACHGTRGEGDGPVVGPNRFPAPPSLNAEQARGYSDGAIFHIVTRGTGKMPPYAPMIDPEDRWQAVMYVRALQRAMNPRPEDLEKDGK